jgi:signal transduction histidine kinase
MNSMRKKLGITGKLVVSSVAIFAALWLAMTVYSVSQFRHLLYRESVRRVEAQVLNWIEANILQITVTRDPGNLDRLIRDLNARPGISYVMIVDVDSRVLAQSGLPSGLSDAGSAPVVAGITSRLRQTRDSAGHRFLELVTPVKTSGTGMSRDLETMFELASKDALTGQIRTGIEQREIDRELISLAPQHILLYTLLVLLALAVNVTFATRVAQPVKAMARVANQISAGNFSERVRRGVELSDEVGELARNFNQMAERLAEHQHQMDALHADLERKVAERTLELERANRRLQDFLSTVSHELRTPLTSIKAFGQILQDSPLDDATRVRYLDIIDKEADRLTRLISGLLDLAKIKRDDNWSLADADLREIVSKAIAPLAALGTSPQVRLESAGSAPIPVFVDSDRIQQVVTNLVGNAIKFSPENGGIAIRIEERSVSGPHDARAGRFAVVGVSDTGPGIAPEERERIFDSFYRGSRRSPRAPGSGLGLTISKGIVLHHGGEIWVDSEPGSGSTFYFSLPIAAGVPANAVETHAAPRRTHAQEGHSV